MKFVFRDYVNGHNRNLMQLSMETFYYPLPATHYLQYGYKSTIRLQTN